MQVTSLEIVRGSSYSATPGQFIGKVDLTGESGTQTIHLSATAISAIFSIVREEAAATAKANAAAVSRSIESASNEPLLLSSISGD